MTPLTPQMKATIAQCIIREHGLIIHHGQKVGKTVSMEMLYDLIAAQQPQLLRKYSN